MGFRSAGDVLFIVGALVVATVATGVTGGTGGVEEEEGATWAWGFNGNGHLGDGSIFTRITPVPSLVPGGLHSAAGQFHSVTLTGDGSVWSSGRNEWGQLGDGTTTQREVPVRVVGPGGEGSLEDVVQVSAGEVHSVALRGDGTVWAWGNNGNGRLGNGGTGTEHTPVQVVGPDGEGFLGDIVQVSAGQGHTVALRADGTVWAWGSGANGRLGVGSFTNSWTPVQVHGPGGEGFLEDIVFVDTTHVSTGGAHTLAVRADGTLWAWGLGASGRLGDGTGQQRTTPVQVVGAQGVGFLQDVVRVSAGGTHSLAVTGTGHVYAWGGNGNGQLGDGTTQNRNVPVQVLGPGGAGVFEEGVQVATGNIHSFVRRADETVWGWGWNGEGRLGDGTTQQRTSPVQVVGPGGSGFLEGVRHVTAGFAHSLAQGGPVPPAAPGDVVATAGPGLGEITITWSPPDFDGGRPITGYTVYHSATGGGPFSVLVDLGPVANAFKDSGLGDDVTRHYRVSATNEIGEGDLSDVVSATTFTLPGQPRELVAQPGTDLGELVVSWLPPEHDGGATVSEYRLYRSGGGAGDWGLVATLDGSTFSYTDSGDLLTAYDYRVSAVNLAGEGPASEPDCSRPFPWAKVVDGLGCALPV